MGDTIIKGVKRATVSPTSRRTSATTAAKNRALAGSSARLKPLIKKAKAEKAPIKKAPKAKNTNSSKNKATKLSSAKIPVAKNVKSKVVSKKPIKTKTTPKATAAKKSAAAGKVVTLNPQKAKTKKAVSISKIPKPVSKSKKTDFAVKAKQPIKAKKIVVKSPEIKSVKKTAKTVLPQSKKPEVVNYPTLKQPSLNEAAALKAFEKAHKEFVRGRFAEARESFKQLLEKHSGVVEVAARARTYLSIAESRLKSATSLPKDADSLYDLGVIQLNSGNYGSAQELFEQAIQQNPNAAYIHYGLAAVRARLGELESALEFLQRAFDLQPNLRFRAQQDPDLTALRENSEFEPIVSTSRF